MRAFLIGMVLVLGGCETSMAWMLDVETVSAERVHRWSSRPAGGVLLDIRDPKTFAKGHIRGAVNLRPDQLAGYLEYFRVPKHRRVVLVCYHGHTSLPAAARVRERGYKKVYSLQGGMEAWRARRYVLSKGPGIRVQAKHLAQPKKKLSRWHQLISTLAGLVIKPVHMLLTFWLILWLWRRRGDGFARDTRLLWWGLVAFLVGESFCAANFLSSAGLSHTLDVLHGVGMVVLSALVPWALFVMLDERWLRLSDPDEGCAARRFCGRCWKKDDRPCGAQRLMLFAAPALALVALLPWTTPLRPLHEVSRVFQTDTVYYSYSVDMQLVELRLYPLLGFVLMLVTTAILLRGAHTIRRAQPTFFAGLGLILFSLIRFVLLEGYRANPVWRDFWEEATELVAMIGVAVILRVFREPLGLTTRPAPDAK